MKKTETAGISGTAGKTGYTTGACAAGASLASVLWQTTGSMPEMVTLTLSSGSNLQLRILNCENADNLPFSCGIIKDAGDDIDVTNHCLVIASVEICSYDGEITFAAGAGVGTVTRKGLPLPIGEPAINPVPRQMITQAVRSVIGRKAANILISIPDGEQLAKKTFNSRLGIQGGLSILGTTGIVRPMSEEAVKQSLYLELSMYRAEVGTVCAFATGYSGENYLKNLSRKAETAVSASGISDFQEKLCPVILCSNYIGYLLDCAESMQFSHILLIGRTGKLSKLAANIMYLHSHTAGGQREVVCTHAALAGADTRQIQALYQCRTTRHMQELLQEYQIGETVWQSIAQAGVENCIARTHGNICIGMLLLDERDAVLAQTAQAVQILKGWSYG